LLAAPTGGSQPLTGYQRRSLGIDAPLDPRLVELLVKAGLHVSGVNDHPGGGYAAHSRVANPGPMTGPRPDPAADHLRQAMPGAGPSLGLIPMPSPSPLPSALPGPGDDEEEDLRAQLLSRIGGAGGGHAASPARMNPEGMRRALLQRVLAKRAASPAAGPARPTAPLRRALPY